MNTATMTETTMRHTLSTPTDRTIRVERIFDATRDRVWRAYTEPTLVAQWWGRGNKLVIEKMEVVRGGHWRYVEHAMHFMLGTLLNAFILFYVKSGSGVTALLFLVLISLLLLVNEHPRFHRLGPVVLFGLYSFALTSYLAYLLPVLLGHLRPWMFFVASGLSLVPIVLLARAMARWGGNRARAFRQALGPAIAVQTVLLLLFVARLVPPVPVRAM